MVREVRDKAQTGVAKYLLELRGREKTALVVGAAVIK
jgi:hypothetical protein